MDLPIYYLGTAGGSYGFSLRQQTTGFVYDFADGIARTSAATPVSPSAMTEGSGAFLGFYSGALSGADDAQFPDDNYLVMVHDKTLSDLPIAWGDFAIVGGAQVIGGSGGGGGGATPNQIAIAVDSQLSTTHGDGSWEGSGGGGGGGGGSGLDDYEQARLVGDIIRDGTALVFCKRGDPSTKLVKFAPTALTGERVVTFDPE